MSAYSVKRHLKGTASSSRKRTKNSEWKFCSLIFALKNRTTVEIKKRHDIDAPDVFRPQSSLDVLSTTESNGEQGNGMRVPAKLMITTN